MQFSDVIGQQRAKQNLMDMVVAEKLPHALLINGQEGTGGLPLAIAFVQFLMCSNRQTADSCGTCPNCQKIQRLEHADVHFTIPTIGSKMVSDNFIKSFREFVSQTPYGTTYEWLQFIEAENKQGNITVEECSKIIEKQNLSAYEGGYKVQIIWRAEYLRDAGNKLLKLIEEPPDRTLLLLVVEDEEDVLETIRSRVQNINLRPISNQDLQSALIERKGLTERLAAQVATLSRGSYTQATHLAQHLENDLLPDAKNILNGVFGNKGLMIAKFAEDWGKAGREQQKNFLNYLVTLIGQALTASYIPAEKLKVPPEEAALAITMGKMNLHHEVYQKLVVAIEETNYRIERNAHGKTQLLDLGIRMKKIVHGH